MTVSKFFKTYSNSFITSECFSTFKTSSKYALVDWSIPIRPKAQTACTLTTKLLSKTDSSSGAMALLSFKLPSATQTFHFNPSNFVLLIGLFLNLYLNSSSFNESRGKRSRASKSCRLLK